MNTPDYTSITENGVILHLIAQPRASKTEFAGCLDDRLKLRIASPPVNGKANKEIIRFLAKFFKLPKNRVLILRGETSRRKDILLKGLCPTQLKLLSDVPN